MVVADKMIRIGDRRFELVIKTFKERKEKLKNIDPVLQSPYLIDKHGKDKSFQRFGWNIPDLYNEPSRKFFTLKGILANNAWLRLRALIGANYRADLIYLKAGRKVDNPSQALKVLGSSKATTYRLWEAISLIEDIENMVLA
jgi:hypothetical protein